MSRRQRRLIERQKAKKRLQEPQVKRTKKEQKNFFEKNYKTLLLIPLALLILAVVQIGYQVSSTGDFLNKGVSLSGGITVTLTESKLVPSEDIKNRLSESFPDQDISARNIRIDGEQSGLIIEADAKTDQSREDLLDEIETITGVKKSEFNVEETGPSLGESFFVQTMIAMVIAFTLMGIVVFISFKTPIPSLAVILAALSDILVTLAVVNLLGVKLSTAGIAAFLMLIGYSVDTDILLSTNVLKRKEGSLNKRIMAAFKTGILMSLTTFAAVTTSYFMTDSDVIRQIMMIIAIGLLVDIINTWIQNLGILRWYMERKDVKD